jgi:hypothetical protein
VMLSNHGVDGDTRDAGARHAGRWAPCPGSSIQASSRESA